MSAICGEIERRDSTEQGRGRVDKCVAYAYLYVVRVAPDRTRVAAPNEWGKPIRLFCKVLPFGDLTGRHPGTAGSVFYWECSMAKCKKREAISTRRRFEIFKRDNFTCQYCGQHPPQAVLEIDHIVPVAAGGDSGNPNLITACKACNRGKGAEKIENRICRHDVSTDVDNLRERKLQLLAYYEYQKEMLEVKNTSLSYVVKHCELIGFSLNQSGCISIKKFLDYFTPIDLCEFIDMASTRARSGRPEDIFRYFCGIAWKKIREGQVR